MSKEFDDKIKKSLMKKTDSSRELKEEIWSKIEEQIDNEQMEGKRRMRKQKRSNRRFFGLGSIAAALILMFLVGTAPGHAVIDIVRELFVPEKVIVEELEGMEENTDVTLQKSKLGYVIYFDEERFILENLDNKDRISPKEQADYVPEVSMEIEQIEDKDIENLTVEIENKLKEEYKTVLNEGKVEIPIEGILLYGNKGDNWDDEVVKYYLVDNTQGGTFIIKQQFFLEASEGFGVRFDNMLKEFQIVILEDK
ncbi:MAG: hypothetical protein JJT76_06790 [Clostridiaceae bacterium]|nr:hypothetical protein [Clostridiaceae bacterium]